MMIQSFKNLTVSWKIFMIPAIFGAALVLLAIIAFDGLRSTRQSMEFLQTESTAHILEVNRLQGRISLIHGNLYRMLSWLNSGIEGEQITALAKKIADDSETANGIIDTLIAGIDDGSSARGEAEKLKEQLVAYAEAVRGTAEMAEADVGTAVILMVDTEDQFVGLEKNVSGFVTEWESRGQTEFETAQAASNQVITLFLATAAVALVLAFALSYVLSKAIAGPIRRITGVMGALAEGRLETDVPDRDRRDEIGRMAEAVDIFKANALERQRLEAEERVKTQADLERANRMDELTRGFDEAVSTMLARVTGAVGGLHDAANRMSDIAGRASQQTAAVSTATEEASSNVQTVASASEELNATIQEIARQVDKSSRISQEAVETAEHTNERIKGLANAAEKVGEVVGLINDIAEQTNLLALNATIESARAGEAGKGFAVVAQEVKNLAGQTARATDEISGKIGEIQTETRGAVEAIGAIVDIMRTVNEYTTAIASAIEQQRAATQEISRNVEEAARGTSEVSSNIVTVAESVSETGEEARGVFGAADNLKSDAKALQREVEQFLSGVRSL